MSEDDGRRKSLGDDIFTPAVAALVAVTLPVAAFVPGTPAIAAADPTNPTFVAVFAGTENRKPLQEN